MTITMTTTMAIDIAANPYEADFPLLGKYPDMAFLDSAATAQRPSCVLDAQRDFYETMNSNPLRGLYQLSIQATQAIEDARKKIADFIGCPDPEEIAFTRNTSESLNMLARSYAPTILQPGDDVVISIMEHHSNLIPWQMACRSTGANLVYLRPDEHGVITAEEIAAKITPKAKIVSVAHVSNVFGCVNPVEAIIEAGHAVGAKVFIDGAQSVPHMTVNVAELGCDAFAFSGHKVFGPMGVGVLWGTRELMEAMPPMLTGGEMIEKVTETEATWAPIPTKFEAGTQDAAGIAGLAAAIDYVNEKGIDILAAREAALVDYAFERMTALPYIQIIGSPDAADHHGVIAFNIQGIHPHDVASIMDSMDVAIRAGHHCAQPLLAWLGVESCCRASVAFYNDKQDIDRLVDAIEGVWRIFHGA